MDLINNTDFVKENYYLGLYILIIVVIFISINIISHYTCSI